MLKLTYSVQMALRARINRRSLPILQGDYVSAKEFRQDLLVLRRGTHWAGFAYSSGEALYARESRPAEGCRSGGVTSSAEWCGKDAEQASS